LNITQGICKIAKLKSFFSRERSVYVFALTVFLFCVFMELHSISSFVYFLITNDKEQSYGVVIHRTYNYDVNQLKDSHRYYVVVDNRDTVAFQGQYEFAEKDTIPMLISKYIEGFSIYNGDQYVFENDLIFCFCLLAFFVFLINGVFKDYPPEGPDLLDPDDFK